MFIETLSLRNGMAAKGRNISKSFPWPHEQAGYGLDADNMLAREARAHDAGFLLGQLTAMHAGEYAWIIRVFMR